MRTSGIVIMYVLGLLALLAGCKTSKNTEQQVNRDYSADFLRLSSEFDSLRAGFQLSQRQVTDKLSNLKVEHTTTYYTLPDSTGKQYPVYVSTTKADKDEQETQKTYLELDATIRRMYEKVDSLSNKVDEALRKEQKVAEVSWWDRHKGYVVGAVLGAVAVIVGWMVYRIRRK